MKTDCGLQQRANSPAHRLRRLLRLRGEDGNALVELAIALPIMMTILTGTASFSLALFYLQQLGAATATATQLLGSEQALVTDPCASVVTSVTTSLPNWTTSNFSYSVSITDSSGTAHPFPSTGMTTGSSFSCKSGAADMAQNEPITVTVSYSFTWLPVLKFSPSSNLTATETSIAD
jgi:Flp pilus assembly protein TadG